MYIDNNSPSTSPQSMWPEHSASRSDKNDTLAQIKSIQNIPTEILQKIASYLPAEDYGHLRQTASCVSERLPTIKSIADKFYSDNVCTGELKRNNDNLLYSAMIKEASHQTTAALANRKDGALDVSPSTWVMTCRYPGHLSDDHPIRNILNAMSPEIGVSHDQWDNNMMSATLQLYKRDKNQEAVSAILNKADNLFSDNKKDSGLVLASMMKSLCNHLSTLSSENGERIFPDEVLSRYRDEHREMFIAADIINKFTPTSQGEIKKSQIHNNYHQNAIDLHVIEPYEIINPRYL